MVGRRTLAGDRGPSAGARRPGHPRSAASCPSGSARVPLGGRRSSGTATDHQACRLRRFERVEGIRPIGSSCPVGVARGDGARALRRDHLDALDSGGVSRPDCRARVDAGGDAQPLPSRAERHPAPRVGRRSAEHRSHRVVLEESTPSQLGLIGFLVIRCSSGLVIRCSALRTNEAPYSPAMSSARTYSRVIFAMLEIGISFGHTASHSPSFEQLPNPSASAWPIIFTTLR